MTLLRANKLNKRFGFPVEIEVLKEINLEVEAGQTIAIMGASGEGKSTLLHMLGSLEPASEGELEIVGKRVTSRNAPALRNRHIGFVFQSFYLLEDYSSLQNVLMPSMIGRRGDQRKRGEELIERVGLSHRIDYPIRLLSGGEKQRVAIARALCNSPELILADEPSGNLDSETSSTIHQLLLTAAKEEGRALVVVTHDRRLADLCDCVYTLSGGLLV